MNDEIARGLSSSDPDAVFDALFALGGEIGTSPHEDVLRRAVQHLRHQDPDVRRQAIFAVAIHWGYEPSFSELIRLLDLEIDEDVAEAAVAAIGRLAANSPIFTPNALQTLYRVCVNPLRSVRVRGQAYIAARQIVGIVTPSEYARETLAPDAIRIDLVWFHDLVRQHTRDG